MINEQYIYVCDPEYFSRDSGWQSDLATKDNNLPALAPNNEFC